MKIRKISKNFEEVILESISIAKKYRMLVLDENVLFTGLLSFPDAASVRILKDLNIDVEQTLENLWQTFGTEGLVSEMPEEPKNLDIAPLYKRIIEDAYKVALNMTAPYVGTEHLLVSWYENVENLVQQNLVKKGVDHQSLYNSVRNVVKYPVFIDDKISGEKNSILKMLGKNLTELAKKDVLDPIVGREKEMMRMAAILLRRSKNNPILIGDSGVGKTAIVEGFAQKIVSNAAPFLFRNKSVWQIDSAALFAGSPMRGDVENKLISLIEEVSADKSIILFIDEIHSLLGSSQSGAGGADIASILKPALARGQLRCIGATTYSEYVKYIESDPALARRFQPIFVEGMGVEEAKIILNHIKPTLESYHHVKITSEIIDEAIELSERYITERFLPDKVIDLLDEAAAKINITHTSILDGNSDMLSELENEQNRLVSQNQLAAAAKIRQAKRDIEKLVDDIAAPKRAHSVVRSTDLKDVVSQWTGIPVNSLTTADIKRIKNLDKILSENIIGQKKAVDIVANSLQVAKIGLSDEDRPMASFLFAGPTGVGKTELAKQIAQNLFGAKDNLVQLDMSEFMEAHSVSKLIGSPPGYIGFDLGGQLTEKIRKRPYSVVLFDEIEKAHPDVLNTLLQILEEGKLTDSKGRVANFKNTVVVMTTNLGAEEISENAHLGIKIEKNNENKIEKAYEEMEATVMEELKKILRPELINRIDHVVVFRSLLKNDVESIVKLQLNELTIKLAKSKKLGLRVGNKLIKKVTEDGFSLDYGARNVRRKINELIETELSKYLLDHPKYKGELTLDIKKDKVFVEAS